MNQPINYLSRGLATRWASPENPLGEKGAGGKAAGGRKGAPFVTVPAGASHLLAEGVGSSGTIRRIWATISDWRNPEMLRSLRIDMYWDGAATPAISAPLGDFFGQGLGRARKFESAFFSNPEGKSFNCFVPMPFGTGFKMVLTNESYRDLRSLYYEVNYTTGDDHGETQSYLHAHWRRENPTNLRRDYEFLPRVVGRGRYLGVNAGVLTDAGLKSWWGEGECKIFLDGDEQHATLVGTGTEDMIGTAWGLSEFSHLYQGCPLADENYKQFAFYRYHVPDPVYFDRDIRVTIQQIGCWDPFSIREMHQAGRKLVHPGTEQALVDMKAAVADAGYGMFERQDDWSSCAYFYLDRPENGLPALAPVGERTCGLLPASHLW